MAPEKAKEVEQALIMSMDKRRQVIDEENK